MHPSKSSNTPDQNPTTADGSSPGPRSRFGRPRSRVLMALNVAILIVLVGGTAAYGTLSKTVTLDVDGRKDTVRTFGGDVKSVLSSRDVSVDDSDRLRIDKDGDKPTAKVEPTASVSDGDTIKVQYERPVTVAVDGRVTRTSTHEPTVGKALEELDVKPAAGAEMNVKEDARLPRSSAEIVVSNPKKLTVVVGGKKKTLTTAKPTAEQVVREAGIDLDDDDEISTARGAFVSKGQKLVVTRIKMVDRTETKKVAPKVTYLDDDSLEKGETKVLKPGKAGEKRQKVLLTVADGKVRDRLVLTSKTLSEPTTRVVARGTKAADDTDTDVPDEDAPSVSDNSVWDRIAQCESGGNWSINSGNGYYGGLQFSAQTWKSVGGPGLPHQNSREVQIKYAKILQQRAGWGQWSCAAKVGVH